MNSLRTPTVPSVRRALAIMEAVIQSRRGLGLSAISRKLRFPKSTTHTIVLTLRECEYLRYDEQDERYRIGPKVFDIASSLLSTPDLNEDDVRSDLRSLAEATGLSAHCAILDGDQAVYIAKADTDGMIKVATWVGRRMDAHCTAVGKAILAYLPHEKLDELLKHRGLPRHNPKTISSREALKVELEKIRCSGCSVEDEECGPGVRCVGAPIFNRDGSVIAAISVSGATGQLPASSLPHLQRLVKEAARRISRNLGYRC